MYTAKYSTIYPNGFNQVGVPTIFLLHLSKQK